MKYFRLWRRAARAGADHVQVPTGGPPPATRGRRTVAWHPGAIAGFGHLARGSGEICPRHEPRGDTDRRRRTPTRRLHQPPTHLEPLARARPPSRAPFERGRVLSVLPVANPALHLRRRRLGQGPRLRGAGTDRIGTLRRAARARRTPSRGARGGTSFRSVPGRTDPGARGQTVGPCTPEGVAAGPPGAPGPSNYAAGLCRSAGDARR